MKNKYTLDTSKVNIAIAIYSVSAGVIIRQYELGPMAWLLALSCALIVFVVVVVGDEILAELKNLPIDGIHDE